MRQRMAAICKSSHFFHTEGKRRGVKTTGPRLGGTEPLSKSITARTGVVNVGLPFNVCVLKKQADFIRLLGRALQQKSGGYPCHLDVLGTKEMAVIIKDTYTAL